MRRLKWLLLSVPVVLVLAGSAQCANLRTHSPAPLGTRMLLRVAPAAAPEGAGTPRVEANPSAMRKGGPSAGADGAVVAGSLSPVEAGPATSPAAAPLPSADDGPRVEATPRAQPSPVRLALLSVARAAETPVARPAGGATDPAGLYDLKFEATPQVEKGGAGTVSVRISPHKGAHLSDEAPITLALSAPAALALSKTKASRADMKYAAGGGSLEVPFKGLETGKAVIEAKLKFYICTDKTCAQQEKTASLPVVVR